MQKVGFLQRAITQTAGHPETQWEALLLAPDPSPFLAPSGPSVPHTRPA